MLATTYRHPYKVRAEQVREPVIEHPDDAIVRVTRSCPDPPHQPANAEILHSIVFRDPRAH